MTEFSAADLIDDEIDSDVINITSTPAGSLNHNELLSQLGIQWNLFMRALMTNYSQSRI